MFIVFFSLSSELLLLIIRAPQYVNIHTVYIYPSFWQMWWSWYDWLFVGRIHRLHKKVIFIIHDIRVLLDDYCGQNTPRQTFFPLLIEMWTKKLIILTLMCVLSFVKWVTLLHECTEVERVYVPINVCCFNMILHSGCKSISSSQTPDPHTS